MLNVSRTLMLLSLATLITTGTVVAQSSSMPMASGAPHGTTAHKCSQTPKGCHKNQPSQSGTTAHKCAQTPKGCHKNQPKPPTGSQPNPPQL
jgi:hypothetical protein